MFIFGVTKCRSDQKLAADNKTTEKLINYESTLLDDSRLVGWTKNPLWTPSSSIQSMLCSSHSALNELI